MCKNNQTTTYTDPSWYFNGDSTTALPSNKNPAQYTYPTYPQYGGQQGWVCPKCGRVNAPWVATCPCSKKTVTYTTTTTSTIPDSCSGCSNHPSNGGSGICHCTLGTPTIY